MLVQPNKAIVKCQCLANLVSPGWRAENNLAYEIMDAQLIGLER